ncbi:hypothetical protein ABPE25_004125 [Salmonella enterica subsp. enterica serovar Newport]|nr:hypothetical protein [Salmonella enterica subsp. enterica serovar Newport]EBS4932311.1 hypothetical protein [Salmonella enterica subsp. enterica serovar Mikawasima]EBX9480512.1 hypothetical protein [Salmonella enterica subsp. enterica serovar Abony]ECF0925738.1 hypothetical protein [Salmonella enterica subsp. enterica serovar Coeln]ECG4917589.1 hypothetical protein [Salmonella enterica subsp. enterica serovar Kambole]EDL0140516.1 hypothetical protein [Salmonella enterica subsp. enterica ser
MSKYSYLHELYMAYTDEQDARLQRYMQNVRAACVRSGGYARYKRDSEKFFDRRSREWRRKVGRVFRHLNDDLWLTGKVYSVVNGKIVGIKDQIAENQA